MRITEEDLGSPSRYHILNDLDLDAKITSIDDEHTGIADIDKQIDELRNERDSASETQQRCQRKIDELFLDAMLVDVHTGDYAVYKDMDHQTVILGRISGIDCLCDGIYVTVEDSIQFSNLNVMICTVPVQVRIKKNEIRLLERIDMEKYIGTFDRLFSEFRKRIDSTKDSNQLEIDLR